MSIQKKAAPGKKTNADKSVFQLWSATPTPMDETLRIDLSSVDRVIDHHAALGVNGLMLGGTCGEGPWMPIEDLEVLVKRAVKHNAGRIGIAVQVTDNSSARMLRHIDRMAAAGADYAVIAAPYFMMNATPERIFDVYRETIEGSSLPVICYDRGAGDRYRLTGEQLPALMALKNLVMFKDSSCDPERAAIRREAQRSRPDVVILSGDEFSVAKDVIGGMNGGFLGGAVFNAPLAHSILADIRDGNPERALATQQIMNDLMLTVYGGPKILAWMSGLKYLMKKLGLFSTTASYLGYPLADEFRAGIDALFTEPQRTRFIAPLLRR